MYIIKKDNVIDLVRGDYIEFPINLKTGTFPDFKIYELEEDDVVYFGLMYPNQIFENAIVKKEFNYLNQDSEGNIYVKLLPEDTIDLLPGTYYYEVKCLYKLGDDVPRIDTIVQRTKFNIME